MAQDGKKLAYWRRHFERWQSSGLTRRAYCAREGLALSTFDHWRREARKAAQRDSASVPATLPNTSLTLVPVRIDAPEEISGVRLQSPAGWQVTLPAKLNPEVLATLVARLP